jgi:glycosyltransferase involved in cell wall biosynthesis
MLKYFYLIFAHSIFTQTDDAKEQWSKIFGKSNKNIFVLSNIFELNNKIKSYDNLSNCSEFKIVMAGRLINLKDYEFAIKSFSILSHKYNKNFKVYINGDGELLNSLKELTIKLKLDEIILFKKFNDNIQETFLNSDLFIMTSKIEGMPNALGEAMSCGLACLTLDFPGAKDLLNFKDDFTRQQIILEREVNHFANILNEITNNHCNLKKLGSMNKERIKLHFSKENFLENFSKTFNENIR